MTRPLPAFLAFLLVLAALPAGTGAAAGVYPIDGDHALTSQQAIKTFENGGVVSGNATALDVGLTVAESHDQADMEGYYTDVNRVFVCVDYRESIPRTLRIHLPAAYLSPRPAEISSVDSSHSARLKPIKDGNATAMVVAFEGRARACFSVTKGAGVYFDAKSDVRRWLNKTTGWKPPAIASGEQWTRLPSDAFENRTQYALETNNKSMTIQFDADAGPTRSWIAVPDCENPAEQPICQYPRDAKGNSSSIVLMSTSDDPPAVRYKYGEDPSGSFGSAVRDVERALARALEDLSSFLGGGG